jgi:hypothetical protein
LFKAQFVDVIMFQFCRAIFWLAQNADDVPVPYCTTAQHVVYQYLGDALWDKFQFREESVHEVTNMKMVTWFAFLISYFN